jgi:hypothetical protein
MIHTVCDFEGWNYEASVFYLLFCSCHVCVILYTLVILIRRRNSQGLATCSYNNIFPPLATIVLSQTVSLTNNIHVLNCILTFLLCLGTSI